MMMRWFEAAGLRATIMSEGTVNLEMAARLRWDEAWREKVEKPREPRRK